MRGIRGWRGREQDVCLIERINLSSSCGNNRVESDDGGCNEREAASADEYRALVRPIDRVHPYPYLYATFNKQTHWSPIDDPYPYLSLFHLPYLCAAAAFFFWEMGGGGGGDICTTR